MLKPKPRYFGHLMQKAGSSEKTPILGKTEGRKKRGWQRRRWLDGITNSPGDGEGQGGKPGVLHSMMLQRVRHDWSDLANGFSISHVRMWELHHKESWALKNWCFWTVVLEKTLWESFGLQRDSILKETSPEYSLEGLIVKLKLQFSDHLMWRTDSLEKILMLERLKAG